MRTTTYLCGMTRCCTCGSVRTSRGVGEFEIHDNGEETLINCSDCWREKPSQEPMLLFPDVYKRTWSDVARRYIQRFGGSSFMQPRDVDDAEIYLRNVHGEVIATISPFERFPKPIESYALEDIPF